MFGSARSGKSRFRPRTRLFLEELESRTLFSVSPLDTLVTPQLMLVAPQASVSSAAQGHGGSTVTNPTVPPGAYSPSQISNAYGFNLTGDGSGQTIAIVDAYHDPTIAADLAVFDSQYGLSAPSFTVLNQNGAVLSQNGVNTTVKPPSADATGGWEMEEALDVEWAHAMAPGANIVLVEANSSSTANLFQAVQTAANYSNVSVVSMSWGANEWSTEASYDGYFTKPGVTYVAAAGDGGTPPIYPAISPNVLAVGGTSLTVNSDGSYASESAWSDSGGGISKYEAQPIYQNGVVTQSTTKRTSPDVAYDANPNTGFAVYDSTTYYPYYPFSFGHQSGWFEVGGTSAGAPQWSALIAIANQGRQAVGESPLSGAGQTLQAIYGMSSSDFHDVTSGTSAGKPHYSAGAGYDLVTGRGSPVAANVVAALVSANGSGGVNGLAIPNGSGTPGSLVGQAALAPIVETAATPVSTSVIDFVSGATPSTSSAPLASSTQASTGTLSGSSSSTVSSMAFSTGQTPAAVFGGIITSQATIPATTAGFSLLAPGPNSVSTPSAAFNNAIGLLGTVDRGRLMGADDEMVPQEDSPSIPTQALPAVQPGDADLTAPLAVPTDGGGEEMTACDACFADETSMALLAAESITPATPENKEVTALRGSALVLLGLFASNFWMESINKVEAKERRNLPIALGE